NSAFPDDTLSAPATVWVDRTPPAATILQPADRTSVCLGADAASSTLTVVLQADDHSPRVEVSAEIRQGQDPWPPLTRGCADEACGKAPTVPTGQAVPVAWDVTGIPSGDSTIRLTLCDRAGNRTTVERSFVLTREPPAFSIVSVSRPVFSPNGDGRSDDT